MRAIEVDATVDEQHVLRVTLPWEVPPGQARLIVLYQADQQEHPRRVFGMFEGSGDIHEDFDAPLPEEYWNKEIS